MAANTNALFTRQADSSDSKQVGLRFVDSMMIEHYAALKP